MAELVSTEKIKDLVAKLVADEVQNYFRMSRPGFEIASGHKTNGHGVAEYCMTTDTAQGIHFYNDGQCKFVSHKSLEIRSGKKSGEDETAILLETKKTGFFSVNATARKSEKNKPETNPYVIKFLKKTNWTPDNIGVFAGKIDFPNYNFLEKYIIKVIMWITNGPTDTSKTFEFTDWEDVKKFSDKIN